MSAQPNQQGLPITRRDELVQYLADGQKPPADWRIGAEHEKFVFHREDLTPVAYEGTTGIKALLGGLQARDWEGAYEEERVLALAKSGCTITLEPGGQFELSGPPRETLHEIYDETLTHLVEAGAVARDLGLGFLGLGFDPKWPLDAIPHMPKGRSAIMRRYMPKRGKLGLDMMHRTCTVQVNLDFCSEADMVQKFRIGLALQPVATALFANSPFTEGKPNGYRSYRSQIWTDTDPDRSGLLPFVFEPGFGYERYVDYILDVPMYFVFRDNHYIDAAGQSFRDFLKGELPALPGEIPFLGDWSDHLTTAFPEVRLKRFLEMRGADCGSFDRLCALPALWVGLLYDAEARKAAEALIGDWSYAEISALRDGVPRLALATPFRGKTVQHLARQVVAIARGGLQRRNKPGNGRADEAYLLDTLVDIAETGKSPADVMLEKFNGEWAGDIDRIYEEYAL